jgi:RimJ/RimL family protein N-acetyltransferase
VSGLPSIATVRLELRPVATADVVALHRLWTDPGVRRWLWDGETIPRARAAELVQACIADVARQGVGMWTLRRADAADRVMGFCGFRPLDDGPEVELLYGLAPAWWGHGLATEAGQAALRWAFAERRLPRVWGLTDPPNHASMRVLERLGMRFEQRGFVHDREALWYVLAREDFRG